MGAMRTLLCCALLAIASGCATTPAKADPAEEVLDQYTGELQSEDLVKGTGETALAGMTLTVHYTGWLTDGRTFDSSVGKDPLVFKLGARRVIKGWDQGLLGMKVGGKRKLIIPPQLAYGSRTVGSIPGDSTLIFEIELLAVSP